MPPAKAHAQYSCTTNNGCITITGYDGPYGSLGGAITLPSFINGYPVTGIESGAFGGFWFPPQDSPTSITIPASVTNIGTYAFADCLNLESVTISNGVIGDEVFEGIEFLFNVTLGNGVTSIGEYAFDAAAIESVTIPDSVTNLAAAAFYDCENLTDITFGKGLTSIPEDAFYQCYSLENVTIPNGVTNIADYAFYHSYVSSLTIGTGVANIGESAFYECAMASLTIPDVVTTIGAYAFESCGELTNIVVGRGITSIAEGTFQYCDELRTITLGKNITDIGQNAFFGDTSLSSITIPGSVTNVETDAFEACMRLTNIFFQGNAPTYGSSVFNSDTNATVYYLPGTTGWSNTFAGRPAVLWNPLIQTGGANFGVRSNQFGFNITGTANIPIVIEASTDLARPVWTPLQTLLLTNGSYYFSEPLQTCSPGRYYRISSP